MGNFITHENPIIFLPNLAKVIGTNESLILSLIHYWINPKYNQNFKSDRYWVYNSYEQWQKKLPNLSLITIRRAINKLEKLGVLVSDKLSDNPYLKVKWYSIDYNALYNLIPSELVPHKSATSSDIRVDTNNHHKTEVVKKFTSDQNEQGGDQFDQIICNATNTTTNNKNSLLVTKAKKVIKPLGKELEREMLNLWNEVLGRDLTLLKADSYAYGLLKTPLRFFSKDLELWKDYLVKIASSKFLMGGGVNGWKVSFEWAVREQTIRKVLGGYYTLGDRDISYLRELSLASASIEHEREENISHPLWRQVCERLKASLGKDLHRSWTGKLEYIEEDHKVDVTGGYDGKIIRLNAPSRFIATTIKDRYMSQVREAFEGVGLKNAEIVMEIPDKKLRALCS